MSIEFVLSKEQEDLIQLRVNSAINIAVEKNVVGKFITRDFLRIGEAAEYLGVSYNTLKNFTENYGLKISVIDGTKFISKQNIAEFLKEYEN
ncbi:helix-turn-helix domain-containing protein [Enterococcus hulanensis]|uniref:helix-turn-helix domain-containing protein n=1 Tax=Enterococcus TaxID=1350 RepID=UPI000B5AB391|nr:MULTISPECIES: helix-turn-helix domain-containing protein [Enterococcus]MBO0412460.1 helix-turn-helix domain-containing protein [Enterococcus hulanensis]OTO15155.1 hypothetical protein A5875_004312 [Enterococcus sp. 3H8_DIV0648]